MAPARRLAGWEDLLALPEGVQGEVIAGELSVAPSALPRHSRVQRTLGRFVGGPFDDDDGRDGQWLLEGRWADTGTARIPPFEAVELDLARLFPPV